MSHRAIYYSSVCSLRRERHLQEVHYTLSWASGLMKTFLKHIHPRIFFILGICNIYVISNSCIEEWLYHNWLTTTSSIHSCFHIILLLFKYTLGRVASFYLCVLLTLSSVLALVVCPASVAVKKINSGDMWTFDCSLYVKNLIFEVLQSKLMTSFSVFA